MRKLLIFLSTNFILISAPMNIIACGPNNQELIKNKAPEWVHKMVQKSKNQISIGYNSYFLINKAEDKADRWQQHDWIDLSQDKDLYLYLPTANSINEAVKQINVDDSAKTETIQMETPITWTKLNETTYTNNTFITQDTSVGGVALIDNTKFEQIKESNISQTWTETEKQFFEDYGSFPVRISPGSSRKNQNWWNANGWEKLLSEEKNLTTKTGEKFSQLDLYNKWISQSVIGMNVPLSLLEKGTFKIQTTDVSHVFLFQTTAKQAWIDNSSNLKSISTPHWGFTMNIIDQHKKVFQTPQLINLKNTFKESKITDYLKNKAKYYSFNSQETTKFAKNKIN